MRQFIAIDIETGGLDPRIHPITEVGLVFEHEGRIEEVEFSLPFDPTNCDPVALKVQKYGEREYAPQWSHYAASQYLVEVTRDKHLVGKNPWFDAGFIEVFLKDWGFNPGWHHRLVDVGCLAWGYVNGARSEQDAEPVRQPPNSGTVGDLMGLPLDAPSQHAALYDAKWAWDVFREVVPG